MKIKASKENKISILNQRVFIEKISPFLKDKLDKLIEEYGPHDPRCLALSRQYLKSDAEEIAMPEVNRRHYEAAMAEKETVPLVKGVERLYRRTMVIELTMSCAANCRYCLRKEYELHTLTEQEIKEVARYCGNPNLRDDVNEVLITGGDPFLIPQRLNVLVDSLMHYAPNIKIMRIATRLPQQAPERVSDSVLDIFRDRLGIHFEIATQTSHKVEFFPEVRDCFRRILEVVPKIYSQNVLLKGINDNPQALLELYDTSRLVGLESHYLFHAVPMRGTHHFRTSIDKGLKLIKHITSCGYFSGRAKPMFSAMTDIGKITFYEGTIIERDRTNNSILLQSHYRLDERIKWNPFWKLPNSARVDKNGYLQVWYLDGED